MERTYEPDRIRIEELFDWSRSSGENMCEVCGCSFWKHQPVPGYNWLRKICDGSLVKL